MLGPATLERATRVHTRAKHQRDAQVALSRAHVKPEILVRELKSLTVNSRNVRTHSKKQIGQIAESIKAFGCLVPIVVNEAGQVLAGHGRFAALQLLGVSLVPCVVATGLTDTQQRAFMLADNRIAQNAGWDRKLLTVELRELAVDLPEINLDLAITGFEVGELQALVTTFEEVRQDPADNIPTFRGPVVSRHGDIWALGSHRLACADARSRTDLDGLMAGEQADLIFTDGPFAVPSAGYCDIKYEGAAWGSGVLESGFSLAFLASALEEAARVARPGALAFMAADWRYVAGLIEVGRDVFSEMVDLIVWDKARGGVRDYSTGPSTNSSACSGSETADLITLSALAGAGEDEAMSGPTLA